MNLNEFTNYTNAVKQLVSFNKHFGFDEDDINVVGAYCKDCHDSGFLVDEDISNLVDFSHGLKIMTSDVPCDMSFLVEGSMVASRSIEEIVDEFISVRKDDFFDFSGDVDLVSTKIISADNCLIRIKNIPFTGKLIVKIRGELKVLFSFYVSDRKERLSIVSDEVGYVLKDEAILAKGKFGTPLPL
ncbi:hypothetical protein VB319_19965 [Vibrio parahaemolyticus]|uniref:hypothetical protein n=1 Tax=Vibrio parahaemolyticus TaxID=670 RepID=UPI001A204AC9|nr:hypothetical protein [Vibrio parahaemolyticus]MEA5356251.1 hypothetical protein [Vibrio parahaemolyticus]HAT8517435.1 hypothetical protein [Vibrio vulnificus]